MVEYALIVGLIALGCVVAMGLLGKGIGDLWTAITTKLNSLKANLK